MKGPKHVARVSTHALAARLSRHCTEIQADQLADLLIYREQIGACPLLRFQITRDDWIQTGLTLKHAQLVEFELRHAARFLVGTDLRLYRGELVEQPLCERSGLEVCFRLAECYNGLGVKEHFG
jgi:hypothetical protein